MNANDYLIFALLIREAVKTISSKLHEAGYTKKHKKWKEAWILEPYIGTNLVLGSDSELSSLYSKLTQNDSKTQD